MNSMKHILEKGRKYKYNSLEYIDVEDIIGAEIFKETEKCIFIYKVSRDKIQLYWASNSKENFIEELNDFLIYANGKTVYIEFIPEIFISDMGEVGFNMTSEFVDYWQNDLNTIESQQQIHSILIREIRNTEYLKASNITKTCKSQSRGFAGETENTIKQWSESENSKIFVVEKDGKRIGVSLVNLYGFDSEKGIVLWIRLLAVNPEYQRQGVGRSLLNYSINWGKSKGAKRSFLASDVQNDNAIQLYKDFGYETFAGRGQINMEN